MSSAYAMEGHIRTKGHKKHKIFSVYREAEIFSVNLSTENFQPNK